jgi:cellulose synthase/poly-beta-1,6-N-acetylglucosamine synthase-like glycosyltransferase
VAYEWGGVFMNAFVGSSVSVEDIGPFEGSPAVSAVTAERLRCRVSDHTEQVLDWSDFISRLMRLGVSPQELETCRRAAHKNGSTLSRELIAEGLLDEVAYYKSVAADFGLTFVEAVDPNSLIVLPGHTLSTLRNAATIKALAPGGERILLTAPDDRQLAVLVQNLKLNPRLRETIALTTRSGLDQALIKRMTSDSLQEAVFRLRNAMPSYSASQVATGTQGVICGFAFALMPLLGWWYPMESLLACHILASLVFAACVFIRVRASSCSDSPENFEGRSGLEGPYPVYSVIVALYRETAVVPQLLSHLMSLNWPASRLEIFIVCEASDTPTINLLERLIDRARVQVVHVPALGPQTKPRALTFALQAARGEFVVIYDAEDRPHPDQLMEAYERFQREPMSTACLQAPLVVTNQDKGFFARMFAFEYAALFGGLLPYLSTSGRFMPLGGTSNHFRRSVLQDVGGWDPFNVTEDADLGTRLCRLGYNCGMISKPTFEDAPTRFSQWRPQRIRWFKGWLQTWLVHMRAPHLLFGELGRKDFARFQLLTIGMCLSALIYPWMLAGVILGLYAIVANSAYEMSAMTASLFAIDFCNVMLGHLVFSTLGSKVEKARGVRTGSLMALRLPIYWTLLSLTAWGALWELIRKPHHWNKTEHFPVAVSD